MELSEPLLYLKVLYIFLRLYLRLLIEHMLSLVLTLNILAQNVQAPSCQSIFRIVVFERIFNEQSRSKFNLYLDLFLTNWKA